MSTTLKCPHCGFVIKRGVQEEYRQEVLKLADGTRSIAEIASILGKSYNTIRASIQRLQATGHDASFKRLNMKLVGRYDDDALYDLVRRRASGVSYNRLAFDMGMNATTARKIIIAAGTKFGVDVSRRKS